MDLYSSTRDALRLLLIDYRQMLKRVVLYFDDVLPRGHNPYSHRFAGELLAIHEFNEQDSSVKIDRWRGVRTGRPRPEERFLCKLYVAHNLKAISGSDPDRENVRIPLRI